MTILDAPDAQTDRRDCCVSNTGPHHIKILGTIKFQEHLNSLGEQAQYIKFESRENLKKDTSKNAGWQFGLRRQS